MSDGRDDDPADWFARQFRDAQPDNNGDAGAEAAADPLAAEPAAPSSAEPAEPARAAPFDWGFGTADAAGPMAAGPPAPIAPEPSAAVPIAPEPIAPEPIAPATPAADLPTQAWPIVQATAPEPSAAEKPAAESAAEFAAETPAEVPTKAFSWFDDPATTVAIPAADLPGAPPAASARPFAEPAPTERIEASAGATPIDSLFGETSFKDYDESLLAGVPAAVIGRREGGGRPPREPGTARGALGRNQRVLIIVAAALVGVLILVVLFFIGTRLAGASAAAPVATKTPTATKTVTPTPTPTPTGAASLGVHKWTELRGGECIGPFTTVWAETFTVVDCATPHPAQMVFRGTFPTTPAAASTASPSATPAAGGYPGVAALQSQLNLLCTAPGVIDLAVAGGYTDIQFQGAFAGDAAEWDAGMHDYFCFVTRSSGQPLTNSVAGTPAK